MITVLIPAHNEESNIANAIDSLNVQTRQPDKIVVIADNCTDRTGVIASSMGVDVVHTVDNTQKKAGALNQVLDDILNTDELYLVMDADTVIGESFLEVAENRMSDKTIGAVGGLFYGEPGHGVLGALQRNEYQRYSGTMAFDESKTMVLSGTASLFRGEALYDVARLRGSTLPGISGDVYDTNSLTEDNELTIALKTLGWKMVSPQECNNITEVMPTWTDLWKQRKRWQRGAIENLRMYGLTKTTRKYWFQQLGIAYGVLSFLFLALLAALVLLSTTDYKFYPFWIGVTAVFVIERVRTVWKLGWQSRLVAAPLVIEVVYDLFLQAVFIKSVIDSVLKKQEHWQQPTTRKPMVFMMSSSLLLVAALAINLGQYPQLASTAVFQFLIIFVTINTVFFAVLGAMKATRLH